MTQDNVSVLIKSMIESQIVQALNTGPDIIEKLVKAALAKPVTENGSFDGYGSKQPYLDWLVGEEIRNATSRAVSRVLKERTEEIEGVVRQALSSDTIVNAVTKAFVGAAEEDWRIKVEFAAEPKHKY